MPNTELSFPILETDRLQLRQLLPTDAPVIYSLRSDPYVHKYLDRPIAKSMEDAIQFIDKILNGSSHPVLYWGIVLKTTQSLVGTICLYNVSTEEQSAEIGYELLPTHQGIGLMQQAITVVIDYGFTTLKLRRIDAVLQAANFSSIKLLEKNNFQIDLDPQRQEENMAVYKLEKDR